MTKPGDKVKIITEKEEFEGILMPRPEILDKDITVLKLDSGYNIGINKEKIKEIKLIETYKPQQEKKEQIKHCYPQKDGKNGGSDLPPTQLRDIIQRKKKRIVWDLFLELIHKYFFYPVRERLIVKRF